MAKGARGHVLPIRFVCLFVCLFVRSFVWFCVFLLRCLLFGLVVQHADLAMVVVVYDIGLSREQIDQAAPHAPSSVAPTAPYCIACPLKPTI
jgi:hypothetical protein